jgi:hypothetical protein
MVQGSVSRSVAGSVAASVTASPSPLALVPSRVLSAVLEPELGAGLKPGCSWTHRRCFAVGRSLICNMSKTSE